MAAAITFDNLLDAVSTLPPDDQHELVRVISARLREQRREELLRDVREGQEAYQRGELTPTSVEQIMREIDE